MEPESRLNLYTGRPGALTIMPRMTVEHLRRQGFNVDWRFTRDGSPRFKVSGGDPIPARHVKRELTAHEMSDRYHYFL
jgi:hypothetical protein